MKILSNASMKRIKGALISAYSAVMQDVTGKWEMPVSTFTELTDSIAKIAVELGIDYIPFTQQYELEKQITEAAHRLKTEKSRIGENAE